MWKRRPGLLAKLTSQGIDGWISSYGNRPPQTPMEELLDPGIATIRKFTDDELAEAIASGPNSKMGLIAASVLRSRESWRTPAKWALIISLVSLGLSIASLIRSL